MNFGRMVCPATSALWYSCVTINRICTLLISVTERSIYPTTRISIKLWTDAPHHFFGTPLDLEPIVIATEELWSEASLFCVSAR